MDNEHFMGRTAISRGYASAKEVLECLKLQVSAEAFFGKHFMLGEILYLRGNIDERQYAELCRATTFSAAMTQRVNTGQMDLTVTPSRGTDAAWPSERPLIGECLIARGVATPEDVLRALDIQKGEDEGGKPHRPLGEILVAENVVTRDDLDSALKMVMAPMTRKPRQG